MKDKIAEFRKRQAEIVKLDAEISAKMRELQKEVETRAQEIQKPLQELVERYKADVKAVCGVTDGETTNILDVVELVFRVMESK